MFPTINAEYTAAKRADADNALILESVLGEDETLPGSDEEFEEIVDPDSVPADVYARIDKELDRIVGDPSYDDTEAEEMLDDDFDVDDISDAEIDAIMDEAITCMARSEKIAGIVANLSEKAGMNAMARENGMGLLKVLSESVQRFHNDKMEDPIGQAYEPVSTPDKSIDETKLENEALKESAVNRALARFHAIMEEANPDVEDFPGKSGTTRAYGDTPAGMPEPNGNEDGSNVGGDDRVIDREAREVEVEDGGDDVIKVIKANEATGDCAYGDKMNEAANRYRAIAEKICPICGEEEGSAECSATCTKEKLKSVIDAAKKKLGRDDTCPKCGLPKDSEACKEQCTDADREGLNEKAAVSINPDGSINFNKVSVGGTAAKNAVKEGLKGAAWGAALGATSLNRNVRAAKAEAKAAEESGDKEAVEAAKKKLSAARKAGAIRGAKSTAAVSGALGAAGGAIGAKAYNKNADTMNRLQHESVTNPDVEDFPNQTGAGNDHGEKEGALPQGQEPADFPNSTGDKKVNSGDDPTSRYKAVAEAAIEPIATPFCPTCKKPMAKDTANKRWICPHCGKTRVLREAIENPDVEDFPGREGTDSAEGDAAPRGMEHCDDSCQPAYEDQSAYEQREVGVEDGGTDAINVIKANENCRMVVESARAKAGNPYNVPMHALKTAATSGLKDAALGAAGSALFNKDVRAAKAEKKAAKESGDKDAEAAAQARLVAARKAAAIKGAKTGAVIGATTGAVGGAANAKAANLMHRVFSNDSEA